MGEHEDVAEILDHEEGQLVVVVCPGKTWTTVNAIRKTWASAARRNVPGFARRRTCQLATPDTSSYEEGKEKSHSPQVDPDPEEGYVDDEQVDHLVEDLDGDDPLQVAPVVAHGEHVQGRGGHQQVDGGQHDDHLI